jgi:HNH endonuclease
MTSRRDIQRHVETRAAGRCEYCRMHQSLQGATFHVEHVVPQSRGGHFQHDNLAWACPSCNLHKANRVEVVDPDTGDQVPLFNPRADPWDEHLMTTQPRCCALSYSACVKVPTLVPGSP